MDPMGRNHLQIQRSALRLRMSIHIRSFIFLLAFRSCDRYFEDNLHLVPSVEECRTIVCPKIISKVHQQVQDYCV